MVQAESNVVELLVPVLMKMTDLAVGKTGAMVMIHGLKRNYASVSKTAYLETGQCGVYTPHMYVEILPKICGTVH